MEEETDDDIIDLSYHLAISLLHVPDDPTVTMVALDKLITPASFKGLTTVAKGRILRLIAPKG